MPLYTKGSLGIGGLRPLFADTLCYDSGQEDFANSEHSGRWLGGAFVLRKVFQDITQAPTSFTPNSTQTYDVFEQIGLTPNWGFYVSDVILESRVDVGATPSGTVSVGLFTSEGEITDPTDYNPAWPPTVITQGANSLFGPYGAAPGIGGRMAFRSFQTIYLSWDASGFSTLNASQISFTLFGYLVPDPTNSTS